MTEDHHQVTLGSSDALQKLDEVTDLEEVDWTFDGWDTREYTHGLHNYPARMVPQIARAVLSYYRTQGVIDRGSLVYDPFSGSGTTAVEARLAGMHAKANDINPLARLLTLAKARPLNIELMERFESAMMDDLAVELRDIREQYESDDLLDEDVGMPDVRDGWFPEPQLHELCIIRNRITRLEEEFANEEGIEDVGRFFRVALSKTTRKASYQRNGEFKRYRLAEEDRETHDPNVYDIFSGRVERNTEMMRKYSERVDHDLTTDVYLADSREAEDINTDSVDIVVTSPPYGDHGTTVAYGQYSQDPAIVAWGRGYDEMRSVDKVGLGGSTRVLEPLETLEEWSPSLTATLETLRERDGRSDDAMMFFRDYYAVMEQVARVLKPGHPVAWVVANRTMSRVNIPTHLITKELCEHIGFEHQHMLAREIPNKTLPWSNAPENVSGVTGDLMANENIVVMTAPTN